MGCMESVESKNMKSNIDENEDSFNFPTLPYVCQRRFAEICDSHTLKTFPSINQKTQNLCKRCHIIENVNIDCDNSKCKYRVLCFSKESEFCEGVDNIFQLVKKADIRNSVTIQKINNRKLNRNLLQKLPITFQSTKYLYLSFDGIDLEDLKMITSSIKFKYMHFLGDIKTNPAENIIKYIKDLSKSGIEFKFTCKINNAWNFSNGFINELEMLKSQKIVTGLSIESNHRYFPNNTILFLSKE